jgi:hypothetical protein
MPEPYPNHLISLPRSIVSLSHYLQIHDQRPGRTALYGAIVALLVTIALVALQAVHIWQVLKRDAARHGEKLPEKLEALSFAGGKAQAKVKQPCELWEDLEPLTAGGAADSKEPPKRRVMVVVLDTTGAVTTPEKALGTARYLEPQRIIVFGKSAIRSLEPTQDPKQEAKRETYQYSDGAKVGDLRTLLARHGAKFPEPSLEQDGAKFDPHGFPSDRVHVLVYSPELLVLVDATGEDLDVPAARWRASHYRTDLQAPEFTVLITASQAIVKWQRDKEAKTLDFEGRGDLTAAGVGQWIAATALNARREALVQALLPLVLMTTVFDICPKILILALICSVAGLIVNGYLRAGIPYGQVLTMAVYATAPACLATLLALSLLLYAEMPGGQWVLAVPFAVGMAYTGLATWRTATELGSQGTQGAPPL